MERTGPAGAPPPATGRPDEVVSDPLVAAAMCLKNVLILVESTLRADTDGAARSPSSKPASEQMAGETQTDGLMGLKTIRHPGVIYGVGTKLYRNLYKKIGVCDFNMFFFGKHLIFL